LPVNAFNCPQCGATLEYERITSNTVRCHYCNSTVIVPAELRPTPPPPRPDPKPLSTYGSEQPAIKKVVPAIVGLIIFAVVIAMLFSRSSKPNRPLGMIPNNTPRPIPTPTATPKPDGYTIAFTFGGEGTGAGFFKDEMGVAVDGAGRIYVSDDTRRVQRFDSSGQFLSTWNIPTQTKWYAKLKGAPQKLLANSGSPNLFAVMAGVVVKFDTETGEALGAAHGSDYIHDAALLPDGGFLLVSQKGRDDELVHLGGDGRAASRTHRFVSSLLDKELEVEALRVAADGTGNTFALYALGGVAGEHWYDDADLAVFKFSPEGKYLSRFGSGGHEPGQFGVPSAIAVDNQSRVYICEPFDKIHVYADDGRFLRTLHAPHMVEAMAFDAQNNFYIAGNHKVSKLVLDK
jgi:DNA-directed RNA polymerase subunit RPC12/RpoP